MPRTDDTVAVDDQFPDEHLFVVAVKTTWYAEVANYLAMGKLPKHLTPREMNRLFSVALISPGLEDTFSTRDLICTSAGPSGRTKFMIS